MWKTKITLPMYKGIHMDLFAHVNEVINML